MIRAAEVFPVPGGPSIRIAFACGVGGAPVDRLKARPVGAVALGRSIFS